MHTYMICLSSRRFLTGGFCLGFLSGRFCPGWVLNVPSSVRMHPLGLQQKAKNHFTFNCTIHMYEIFLSVKSLALGPSSSPRHNHKLSHILGPPLPLERAVLYGRSSS